MIDTLGYVKRLQQAGISREHAEAPAEAMRDDIVPQLATKSDLEAVEQRLSHKLELGAQRYEAMLLRHTVAIILTVVAVGGFLMRFLR